MKNITFPVVFQMHLKYNVRRKYGKGTALMIQNDILRQVRETLYCPETGLIYDYVTSREPAQRFAHLPCRAEVEANLPNPCGWGTGMEDCAINAGTMLDTLWRIDGDPLWAARLVDGMERCITLHGSPPVRCRV